MKQHPDCSRKQIREALKKQFIWFYRHDREWLEKNLPPSIPRNSRNQKPLGRVNWKQRDEEILIKIKKLYPEFLEYKKPIRITESLIGSKLGIKPLLDRHLDLLPKTQEYLKKVTETIEQFQLRRVEWVYTQLQEQKKLKKWELVRMAGLRPNYSEIVDARIDQLIET